MTQPDNGAHAPEQFLSTPRQTLRRDLLAQRRAVPAAQRAAWDRNLQQQLLEKMQTLRPASLALYWPIRAEPDLRAVYAELQALGIQLALPWVVQAQAPLRFLAWQPGDAMEADSYGIPLPAQRSHLLDPAVILIPCVGFNTTAYRLGYGGGFYDRTLAQLPQALALGIAYPVAACEFEPDHFDLPMHEMLVAR
ncbi:5-formyltetrahydrofolate cyclo-ligase [Undibacterium sp. CY7W]|uniref:5-formyltetrahydrofolate cyclo-ligase n=1 Tax=Undibacterium rugosum TaxID=2762291 RepID=A0A923HZE7_9BURK|nr:5-formyltetrahydrofolate cyclo-ligase [Undibacterium rugosum]MBC3934831.1 5-formyltetrahydrofolate cyclo-ligase [Undibacterium rugosum]